MTSPQEHARYRQWYKALIGLYPQPYRETFGEELQQTFADMLRERSQGKRSLLPLVAWVYAETALSVFKEQGPNLLTFFKAFGGLLWSLAVATIMIVASLRGHENAWWLMLVVHAVVSALYTLLHRYFQKKGHTL